MAEQSQSYLVENTLQLNPKMRLELLKNGIIPEVYTPLIDTCEKMSSVDIEHSLLMSRLLAFRDRILDENIEQPKQGKQFNNQWKAKATKLQEYIKAKSVKDVNGRDFTSDDIVLMAFYSTFGYQNKKIIEVFQGFTQEEKIMLIHQINLSTVILPTDKQLPIITGEGGKPFEKREYDPNRFVTLEQIITRLGLDTVLILKGIVLEEWFGREYSYRFELLDNGVIVAMCPQFGEATFVMTLDDLKNQNSEVIESNLEQQQARLTAIAGLTKLQLRDSQLQIEYSFTFVKKIDHDKENRWQGDLESTIANPRLVPNLEGYKNDCTRDYTEQELLEGLSNEDLYRYKKLSENKKEKLLKFLKIGERYIDNNVYPSWGFTPLSKISYITINQFINNHTHKFLNDFEISLLLREFYSNYQKNKTLSEAKFESYMLFKIIQESYLSKGILPSQASPISKVLYRILEKTFTMSDNNFSWLQDYNQELYTNLYKFWENKDGKFVSEAQYKIYIVFQRIAKNIETINYKSSEYYLLKHFRSNTYNQWLDKYDEKLAQYLRNPIGEAPVPRVVEADIGQVQE